VKRTLTAAAVGFLLGYTYAFVSCLVGSKQLGSLRKDPPHPSGPCAQDCPWPKHPGREARQPHANWEDVKTKAAALRAQTWIMSDEPSTHWDEYFEGPHPLDGSDMHDVLPTDDECPFRANPVDCCGQCLDS
jgi:hypothetical protein